MSIEPRPTPESVAATVRHIEMIHRKRARLLTAALEAEAQYVQAVWREHQAGRFDWCDLRDCYERIRDWGIQGYGRRWTTVIPYDLATLKRLAATIPDECGSWSGSTGWPIEDRYSHPANGVFVVYILLNDDLAPVYVGSTKHFRERLKRHYMAGKRWSSWIAHPCGSRKEAYEIETKFLQQYQPPMNRTRSAGGAA